MQIKADRPLSLNEMRNAQRTRLHNSNMENLTNALDAIDEAIDWMDDEVIRLSALKKEIETFSSDPENLQKTAMVKDLHGRATKPSVRY